MPPPAQAWPASAVTPTALLYPPETLRTEFAVLTDFLETLDERAFFGAPAPSTVMATPVFPAEEVLPAATKTERFLLTAADQEEGSRDERLNRVIRSKYEAGLLRPYNYVTGYARLSRWMDTQWVVCCDGDMCTELMHTPSACRRRPSRRFCSRFLSYGPSSAQSRRR
jgi:hypothetical protein